MSVLYVCTDLYNKSIDIGSTNQHTKCVWRNTPKCNVESVFHGDKGTQRPCRLIRDEGDKTKYVLSNHIYIYMC